MNSDNALLFGLLALQCGFISKEQLIEAMAVWTSNKQRSLELILVENNALTSHQHSLLKQLETEILQQHNHSAERSLASLSSIASVRQALEGLADAQLNATLVHVGKDARDTSAFEANETGNATRREGALRYRTIRLHAKGGLGEVFVARDQELNREVALKEIQDRFADHDESRARFKLEAEITGNLEHPGIVPIYGLGQYADGRPYYAMRFIRGDSLKEAIEAFHAKYRDRMTDGEAGLELRKLLRRFVDACNAMEYAHSRGVVHRDLKPGNIILGKYGETLVVDWGLAKAQGQVDSSDLSIAPIVPSSGSGVTPTQVGSIVGTPAYMSPEQASGKVSELAPATDVYSLGATLFHLLTGHQPVWGKTALEMVQKAQSGEIRRPRELMKDVPRPLEAVCLKAMNKNPSQRYESPLALAEEIETWLADEPVSAYAEPLFTRVRRWVRKHPAIVSTSAASALLGLVGAILVAYLNGEHAKELEEKNRTLASQNQTITTQKNDLEIKNTELTFARNAAQAAEKEATKEKVEAESVTDFLVKSFRKADPDQDGKTLTVYESLVRAQKEIDESTDMDPLNKAAILTAMCGAFHGLEMPDEMIAASEKAYQIQVQELGLDHPETLSALSSLGVAHTSAGKAELAVPLLESAVKLQKKKLGTTHRFTLISQSNLAAAFLQLGKTDLAIPLLIDTLRDQQSKSGAATPETLSTQNSLAIAHNLTGKPELAIPLLEATYNTRKATLGEAHSDTLTSQNNLAGAYIEAGKYEPAILLFKEALAARKSKFGEEHRVTLSAQSGLANAYSNAGKLDLALPLFEATLQSQKAILAGNHSDLIATQCNLAVAYNRVGKTNLAIPLCESAIAATESRFGQDHPTVLTLRNNLAEAHSAAGNAALAIPLFEAVWKTRKIKLGEDHPDTLLSQNNLAGAYHEIGKNDLAILLYESTLKAHIAKLGEEHPNTLVSQQNLAQVLMSSNELDRAIGLLESALKVLKSKSGDEHPDTLVTQINLASAYSDAGRHELAIPLFEATLKAFKTKFGDDHPNTLATQNNLAVAYRTINNFDRAIPLLESTLASQKRLLGEDHAKTLASQGNLATALLKARKLDLAIPLFQATLKRQTATLGENHPNALNTLFSLASSLMESDRGAEGVILLDKYVALHRELAGGDATKWIPKAGSAAIALMEHQHFAEARKLLEEIHRLRQASHPDAWTNFSTQSMIGECLLGEKKYAEAETQLLAGFEGIAKRKNSLSGQGKTRLIEANQALISLYAAMQKQEEIDKWKAKLEELQAEFASPSGEAKQPAP